MGVLLSASLVLIAFASAVRASQPAGVDLPKLPARWELLPHLYDKDDCLTLPEGRKCGPPPEVRRFIEANQPEPKIRQLLGFSGPNYVGEVGNTGVLILDRTVSTTTSGSWQAMGLVRNDLTRAVERVVVEVVLYGSDKTVLAKVSSPALVSHLRPGEPGPFRVTSSVPAGQVARAEWRVLVQEGQRPAYRDFLLLPHWESPRGATPPSLEAPYRFFAGFQNWGRRTVNNPQLIVAWLNDRGQVVYLTTAQADPLTRSDIAPRGSGDFEIIVVQNPPGASLLPLTKTMWVVGE